MLLICSFFVKFVCKASYFCFCTVITNDRSETFLHPLQQRRQSFLSQIFGKRNLGRLHNHRRWQHESLIDASFHHNLLCSASYGPFLGASIQTATVLANLLLILGEKNTIMIGSIPSQKSSLTSPQRVLISALQESISEQVFAL